MTPASSQLAGLLLYEVDGPTFEAGDGLRLGLVSCDPASLVGFIRVAGLVIRGVV
jgi:hypothetical protein